MWSEAVQYLSQGGGFCLVVFFFNVYMLNLQIAYKVFNTCIFKKQ